MLWKWPHQAEISCLRAIKRRWAIKAHIQRTPVARSEDECRAHRILLILGNHSQIRRYTENGDPVEARI